MKTFVELVNSNCTRCHNHVVGELRTREAVQRVRSDFAAGCIVIEHEDDPDALVSLITSAGRAVDVGANGERVMVPIDAREAGECRHATPEPRVCRHARRTRR